MHVCANKRVGYQHREEWRFRGMSTNNWGNSLSPYWVARSIALLSGLAFRGGLYGSQWMSKLPQFVDKNPARVNLREIHKLCSNNCTLVREGERFFHLEFGHECTNGWTQIIDIIQTDTQKALKSYSEKFKNTDEWLIYDRPFSNHRLQGYADESMSDVIPCHARVTMLRCSISDANVCRFVQKKRILQMKKRCPNMLVHEKNMSSREEDFARIVFTPNLVIGTAGSTWALWASLANSGNVYLPKFIFSTLNAKNIKVVDVPVYYTRNVKTHFSS